MFRILCAIGVVFAAVGHVTAADAADVTTIYANRCAFCHGTSGKGDGPAGVALKPPPKDLSDPEYWKSADPEKLKAVIADGKPGTAMVAFKDMLTPAEIAGLVDLLKTFNTAD